MFTIDLPFGKKFYVCSICGKESADSAEIERCESVSGVVLPDVKIGDLVAIYFHCTQESGYTHRTSDRTNCVVDNLYYAQPGSQAFTRGGLRFRAGHHQLFVGLALGPSNHWLDMPYDEFLLWREGDEEKLRQARLIDPPRKPRRQWPSWLNWLRPAA